MSFVVDFWSSSEESIVLNKDVPLSGIVSKTISSPSGTLDILNMDLVLKYDSNLVGTNYAHISEFKKYYFVKWDLNPDEQMTAHLEVDVLKSHETEISNLICIIKRTGALNHPTLVRDDLLPFSPKELIDIYEASDSIHKSGNEVAYTLMLHTI